jgi:putative endonuclease
MPVRDGNGKAAFGRSGEALACRHLEQSGHAIAARNWRCRLGEIDIVAFDGKTVVFVEVRTRRSPGRFGTPAESVDARKKARLRRLAQAWLMANGLDGETPVRFDVFDIRRTDGGQTQIRHIRDAF